MDDVRCEIRTGWARANEAGQVRPFEGPQGADRPAAIGVDFSGPSRVRFERLTHDGSGPLYAYLRDDGEALSAWRPVASARRTRLSAIPIRIEAGGDFKIVGSEINTLTGGPERETDAEAIGIIGDIGASASEARGRRRSLFWPLVCKRLQKLESCYSLLEWPPINPPSPGRRPGPVAGGGLRGRIRPPL